MDRKYVSNHYLDFGSVNFGLPDLIGIWKVEENLDVLTELTNQKHAKAQLLEERNSIESSLSCLGPNKNNENERP